MRKYLPAALLSAVILLFSFAPEGAFGQTTRTLALPAEANMGEQAQALRAANEWNVALNGVLKITLLEPGSKADWSVTFETAGMDRTSICDATLVLSRIRCRRYAVGYAEFGFALTHEIGHLLGLGHAWGTVMHPYCCAAYRKVDEASAALVRRNWTPSAHVEEVAAILSGKKAKK